MTEQRIGIIGAGHLGLAVAETLVAGGLDKKRLHISHGTSAKTKAHIETAGLGECISLDNACLCRNSDIVFIAVRPDAVSLLEGLPFYGKTVISTVAGISIARMEALCGASVKRVMLSGPDSIRNRTALGAFFPDDSVSKAFLTSLNVTAYPLCNEMSFHIFTAAVCLPSAYLQIELSDSSGTADLTGAYISALPFWDELIAWSRRATPRTFSKDEKLAYISAMATKGGVTEAIVRAIAAGHPLAEAFEHGVNRSKEIAAANGA
ncbi:MAG: NAD(P)-binding domain-containing protein [Bacteroidales bacterium]|jgi:pyrroline-5-carboxylate reductase|nr:NAD(P)-binding domain-containing protein [Bacteroidales bacterium]